MPHNRFDLTGWLKYHYNNFPRSKKSIRTEIIFMNVNFDWVHYHKLQAISKQEAFLLIFPTRKQE